MSPPPTLTISRQATIKLFGMSPPTHTVSDAIGHLLFTWLDYRSVHMVDPQYFFKMPLKTPSPPAHQNPLYTPKKCTLNSILTKRNVYTAAPPVLRLSFDEALPEGLKTIACGVASSSFALLPRVRGSRMTSDQNKLSSKE